MPHDDVGFNPLLTKIMAELNHHMEEEEAKHLPLLRSYASPETLLELAKEWDKTLKAVPTRPHPHIPDQPPMETIVGSVAAPLDKAKDKFRDFPVETQGVKQHF